MDRFTFQTLEYKRPDLEAHREKLVRWKGAVEQAESYEALRTLIFEMDREGCELSTQYSIAHIRHTLDTRDEFYEAEINYLQNTLPTLGGEEVALNEAIAASRFRPDIEREFGKQYFVSIDLQKKLMLLGCCNSRFDCAVGRCCCSYGTAAPPSYRLYRRTGR